MVVLQLMPSQVLSQAESACLNDQTEFSIFVDKLDFQAAKDACVTFGGTLARISSEEEHNFSVALMRRLQGTDKFFIGILVLLELKDQ